MILSNRIAIVVTTYNSQSYVAACLRGCLAQGHRDLRIIVADDGSTDGTLEVLKATAGGDPRVTLLPLTHGERGAARAAALAEATRQGFDYLLFIDDDMVPTPRLLEACLARIRGSGAGGLVVPEIPWSTARNFFTKVKIFERTVLNAAGPDVGKGSIEAARFWTQEAWRASGGLNEHQIAFEEIQPTLRWQDKGGLVVRVEDAGLYHNEKVVTLRNILAKKAYYFGAMGTTLQTEEGGFRKAIERWYFFRPTLYRRENWRAYGRHPVLAAGMVLMYLLLTAVALAQVLRRLPTTGLRSGRN